MTMLKSTTCSVNNDKQIYFETENQRSHPSSIYTQRKRIDIYQLKSDKTFREYLQGIKIPYIYYNYLDLFFIIIFLFLLFFKSIKEN